MESLISTFHIDIKLLIAQIINFAIVFAVLYFFAFKPIAKIMAERTKKIEKGIKDAETIEQKLEETKRDHAEVIKEAKKEAAAIMAEASQEGETKREEMLVKAKAEIGLIINQEKEKMQQEKAIILQEIRQEAATLITSSLEKILQQKMDSKSDQELIKKTLR